MLPKRLASTSSRTWSRNRRTRWKMSANEGPLVWIDCEMTGLDGFRDKILEICCLVTNGKLDLLDEAGYETVLHCPESRLEKMDAWCTNTHKRTGLWDKCIKSKVTAEDADTQLLSYLQKLIPEKGVALLSGNTVHMDRLFMLKEFPKTIDYLHYRIVDVSSVKEIAKRHNPKILEHLPPKKLAHSARSDICESIAELRWYYDNLFK